MPRPLAARPWLPEVGRLTPPPSALHAQASPVTHFLFWVTKITRVRARRGEAAQAAGHAAGELFAIGRPDDSRLVGPSTGATPTPMRPREVARCLPAGSDRACAGEACSATARHKKKPHVDADAEAQPR